MYLFKTQTKSALRRRFYIHINNYLICQLTFRSAEVDVMSMVFPTKSIFPYALKIFVSYRQIDHIICVIDNKIRTLRLTRRDEANNSSGHTTNNYVTYFLHTEGKHRVNNN